MFVLTCSAGDVGRSWGGARAAQPGQARGRLRAGDRFGGGGRGRRPLGRHGVFSMSRFQRCHKKRSTHIDFWGPAVQHIYVDHVAATADSMLFEGYYPLGSGLLLHINHCTTTTMPQVEHAEAVAHDNEALRAELDRVRNELASSLAQSREDAAAAQHQLAALRVQSDALAAERQVLTRC
jgi:hypothetical protein